LKIVDCGIRLHRHVSRLCVLRNLTIFQSTNLPILLAALGLLAAPAVPARGQRSALPCKACAEWNRPQTPFHIFANTYYVGTRGLSAILITSEAGHVLIDGGLPESAEPIASSVRALGFKVEDVRLILNSHAHFDHAGGIAELQRMSGAGVAATLWSVSVLTSGAVPRSDPQFGVAPLMAQVKTSGRSRTAKRFRLARSR
jgi:metallo-beta-lactamase class B